MSTAGCHGHQFLDSRRLWSLWDMVSGTLGEFVKGLAELEDVRQRVQSAAEANPESIPDHATLVQYWTDMLLLRHFVQTLAMPRASERLGRIAAFIQAGDPVPVRQWVSEFYEVHNAIKYDSAQEGFCHYRRDRVIFLQRMTDDWASAIKAFPSAAREISEGVDCYALKHNAACVFHMARIGEIGLRAVARERRIKNARKNVPLDWGTWGQVFGAIEMQLRAVRQKTPGPRKDAALAFYDTVLSDLHAIQSLFRDRTMHLRKSYDDGEAQSAMFRARELMTTLASKLDENSTRSIPWGAWG